MGNIQTVRDILEAIESVKNRAESAKAQGDEIMLMTLTEDLITLQKLLVTPVTRLIEEELSKKAA